MSSAQPRSEAHDHSVALVLLPPNNSQSGFAEDGRALAQKEGEQHIRRLRPQRQRQRQRQQEQGNALPLAVLSVAGRAAVTADESNLSLSRPTSESSVEVLDRESLESWGAAFKGYLSHYEQRLATFTQKAWFGHAVAPMQALGVVIVFAALCAQLGIRWHRKQQQRQQQGLQQQGKERQPPSANDSPAAGAPPPLRLLAAGLSVAGASGSNLPGSNLLAAGRRPWVRTAAAISLLMSVAASKTVMTKLIFQQVSVPVAFSSLSCVTTILLLLPVFAARPRLFQLVRPHMARRLGVVCVMVAIDLGFTNMAISMLPLALQQCIAATTPAATVTIESVYERRLQHPGIYAVIACLCAGAVLAELGSFGDAAGGGERSLRGELMMLMAVFAASCKYVFAKATVQEYRDELGPFAFLFWVEVFILLILLPWAALNGELATLVRYAQGEQRWLPLCACSALGGVRFFAELLILRSASATSLSTANLATHAAVVVLSIPIFGTQMTGFWLAGCTITLTSSAVYTYLKLSGTLARKEQVPLLTSDDLDDDLQEGEAQGLMTQHDQGRPSSGSSQVSNRADLVPPR